MSSINSNTSDVNLDRVAERPVAVGQPVWVGEGPLDGFDGILVTIRSSGRYLVRLSQGVYIETDRVTICES